MKRYPLIFNPNSRGEKASKAQQFFFQNAQELALYASQSVENAIELINHFADQGEKEIILSGGDGTLNQMIDLFLDRNLTMGIIPTGTMNVYARELGIPTTNLEKAFQTIKDEHISEVDVFRINGAPFVQMAGIGYDAHIIQETCPKLKKKLGPLAYLQSAFKVFGLKPPSMLIETEEGESLDGAFVLLGNGALYGGHFEVFRDAKNNDGLLDILVVKKAGYQAVIDFATNYLTDPSFPFEGADHITHIQTKGLRVTSKKEIPVELDGEYAGGATEFTITRDERGLKTFKPVEKISNDWHEALGAFSSISPW